MRSRELVAAVVLAALAAGTPGCLRNPDPKPRSLAEMRSDTRGAFAVVNVPGEGTYHGELIAISASEVWVLVGNAVLHRSLDRVSELEIFPYKVSVGGVAAWGVLGTLSTISHGFFLVISAPTWILTAGIVGARHSRTAYEVYDGDNWEALAKWARFPQGMPERGLTAAELLHGRQPPAVPLPPAMTPPATPDPVPPATTPPPPSTISPPSTTPPR